MTLPISHNALAYVSPPVGASGFRAALVSCPRLKCSAGSVPAATKTPGLTCRSRRTRK
ncbi:MAG: hypothetical protein LBT00_04315 [Spirochaetaceae bacterium]|nr:hypothetical protein [Spirochaetaceae bacterium]